LEERVKLIGLVSDPAAFLNSLDAFIFPSLWEGQGIVLLEAGLVGRPIIASAVDGILEIIDEETGWLVPAGDETALAVKIDWLADNLDSPLVKERVEKLRSRLIATYDIKKIVTAYQALYQELLKTKITYENTTS
jgi:glycosyltransferase involved in cell wall biosynthesis